MVRHRHKEAALVEILALMTTAIYYRVSTEDQSIDMQRVAVDRWLTEQKYADQLKIYQDLGISGSNRNRPAFKRMLADAEKSRIKAVIVYKLDRLTRDTLTAIKVILRFDELGVRFISTTQPMFSHGTPFRHAMIAIFAELAQMERELIVERIKAGLAAAMKRGVKLGAPIKATSEVSLAIVQAREAGKTIAEIAKAMKLSNGTVHKVWHSYLNADSS